MSKIINLDLGRNATLNKVNIDLNHNVIVLQDGVPTFIHKADPANFQYLVISLKPGEVINTAYDEEIVQFRNKRYSGYTEDDSDPTQHDNKKFEDEMDPSFRVYYDDTQELLNAREKIAQRVDESSESERLFLPDANTGDNDTTKSEIIYRTFQEVTETTKKLVYFNTITGSERHTLFFPDDIEFIDNHERAPYADFIDPFDPFS